MKSFKCAQRLSISMLIVFAVLSAFSCKGMLLPPPTSKTGTLTIALPGNGARRGYTQDDADFFKISIISESTKEVVIPAQEADAETFSANLKAGSYSVIVQGMNNSNVSQPLFYGRTNKVTVTAGETTAATILMRELGFDSSLYSGHMEMVNPDWESGKLPSLAFDYFDFEGWYSDAECTQAITEYPATDSEDFTYPFAKLVRKPVFYATQDGDGNKMGLNADNPMELAEAFTELARFSRETNKVPTLVLLDDVYLDGSQVVWSVNIIGAKGGDDTTPVVVEGIGTGTGSNFVVPFNAGTSCTVKNLIIVNGNAATGIKNAGNLTFENCVFNPDSKDLAIENTGSLSLINCQISNTTGAQGINNTGSLKMTDCSISGCGTNNTLGGGIYTTQPITLINTSITDCNGSYGKMIYCAKEEGSNPTVNGIGAGFEGDFYFDGQIPGGTKYDASTFPVGPTQSGVFYATQTGAGDYSGKNVENAMAFSSALLGNESNPAYNYTSNSGEIPTLYLLEDINLSSNVTASYNVKIIGAGGNDRKGMVTIKSSADSGTLVTFSNTNSTYIVENVIFDGNEKVQCISNKGNLTLNDCYIQNGLTNTASEGGGITTSGNLTINRCKILSCKNTAPSENGNLDKGYGGGIFCTNDKQMTTQIADSLIEGCSSTVGGGGICIGNNCIFTMTNTKVNSCSASRGGGVLFNSFSRDHIARNSNFPVSFINCKITNCTDTENQKSISHTTSGAGTAGYNEDLASTAAWEAAKSKFPSEYFSCSFTDDN